jgi:hypothetical protein
MSRIRSKIDAVITLSPSTCYYMRTGKCSLNIVTDYFVSKTSKTAANDLLFCPRLYRAMCNRERLKPISITPCECGHVEVITGHQRACIASQKRMELAVRLAGRGHNENCPICEGQITFEQDCGINHFVRLRICAENERKE